MKKLTVILALIIGLFAGCTVIRKDFYEIMIGQETNNQITEHG